MQFELYSLVGPELMDSLRYGGKAYALFRLARAFQSGSFFRLNVFHL